MRSPERRPLSRERLEGEPGTGKRAFQQTEGDTLSEETPPEVLVKRFGREKEIQIDSPESGVALMNSSQSVEEWNRNVDIVKAAYGGEYPDWWHEKIIASGLARKKSLDWS